MTDETPTPDMFATARTLSVALPYIQKHDGNAVVVKLGGHAMGDPDSLEDFARDIALMKQCGVNPVVVHGGGPQIGAMLKRLDLGTEFVDGLRVTDRAAVEVVEMVLAGRVNKQIAAAINRQGGRAVGLSGRDANLIQCEKLLHRMIDRETGAETKADLGFVGRPVTVNVDLLETLIASDIIPVIAPIGAGAPGPDFGETFNINGDTAAGAIAGAMRASRLLLLTDVAGVKDGGGTVLQEMTLDQAEGLIERGVIQGGMLPKVGTAMESLRQGVEAVVILDGRAPHAVLLELFTEHGAGTLIRR